MNKKNKANQTAQLSLLIATMVVIEVLSQTIFAAFVLPIKPTLTHIPVIIASIVYGPKIGAYLGGFMGIMSIIRNTVIYTVTFFVLLGIYFLIPNFYTAGGKTLMATIFTTNSIAEMIIAGLLTVSITPMLLRLKK